MDADIYKPIESQFVLYNIVHVFEHYHCCTYTTLEKYSLILPKLLLVDWVLPIQLIHKVVMINFIEDVSYFAWVLFDAEVTVVGAEGFFEFR